MDEGVLEDAIEYYLKENLTVELEVDGDGDIVAKLLLKGELFSDDWLDTKTLLKYNGVETA